MCGCGCRTTRPSGVERGGAFRGGVRANITPREVGSSEEEDLTDPRDKRRREVGSLALSEDRSSRNMEDDGETTPPRHEVPAMVQLRNGRVATLRTRPGGSTRVRRGPSGRPASRGQRRGEKLEGRTHRPRPGERRVAHLFAVCVWKNPGLSGFARHGTVCAQNVWIGR